VMRLAVSYEDSGEILFMVVRNGRTPDPVRSDGSRRRARLV
jgi:hypothetical protein